MGKWIECNQKKENPLMWIQGDWKGPDFTSTSWKFHFHDIVEFQIYIEICHKKLLEYLHFLLFCVLLSKDSYTFLINFYFLFF